MKKESIKEFNNSIYVYGNCSNKCSTLQLTLSGKSEQNILFAEHLIQVMGIKYEYIYTDVASSENIAIL